MWTEPDEDMLYVSTSSQMSVKTFKSVSPWKTLWIIKLRKLKFSIIQYKCIAHNYPFLNRKHVFNSSDFNGDLPIKSLLMEARFHRCTKNSIICRIHKTESPLRMLMISCTWGHMMDTKSQTSHRLRACVCSIIIKPWRVLRCWKI